MMDGSRRVAENGESLGGCSNPYVYTHFHIWKELIVCTAASHVNDEVI